MKGAKTGKQGCAGDPRPGPSAAPDRTNLQITAVPSPTQGCDWRNLRPGAGLGGFSVALQATASGHETDPAAGARFETGANSGERARRPSPSPSNKVPRGVASARGVGGRRRSLQKASAESIRRGRGSWCQSLLEPVHGRGYQSPELKRATAARKTGSAPSSMLIAWAGFSWPSLRSRIRLGGYLEQFVGADVSGRAPGVIWDWRLQRSRLQRQRADGW